MNTFEKCIEVILVLEGDYVDHPADRGGPTKYGITLQSFQHHQKSGLVKSSHIKFLSKEEAIQIYLVDYWNPLRLGQIASSKIALIIFSHIVHSGPVSGVKSLQKTLNTSFGNKLFIDGVLGPKTELALAQVKDEKKMCRGLLQNIQIYYARVCEIKPDQIVFLEGWLKRSHVLWEITA